MRIGFTFNVKPGVASPDLDDRYAEWEDEETIAGVAAALARAGEVIRLEASDELPFRLREARPDIVFNMAEGLYGPNRESHVPAICEFWSIPYTGSDPLTLALCLDKGRTKEILSHHGIPTARFTVVGGPEELDGFAAWPAIVKPLHEGSSMGITRASYCRSRAEVRRAIEGVVARYRQPALVEGYLGGREFTCAILGNGNDARALPIIEINFAALPPDALPIYSYEAKWIWDRPEEPLDIFRCPADVDAELAAAVERTSLAAYRLLRCRDWARIDLRCDDRGVPHVLEVNPLPGIHPDPAMNSCLPKAARAAGLDYSEMILSVLRAGAARHGLVL
ncbi:MAG TPA: D-alanine--D-alanine ligase [Vicinamibacteria bacterium]|nr:D-alanine--D-alanine ligase [Vicinamibacteria bacterium]